jgi:DNA-directed RNA polymerase alpha subunit
LRNGGIDTVGQLLSTPRKELSTLKNVGEKSISIIEEKLRDKGITVTL